METEGKLRIAEVFVGVHDPRQIAKVEQDLVELPVVAVCGVLRERMILSKSRHGLRKLDWFRRYLKLEHGIASHDTFGRVFAAIDAEEFGAAFRRWVSSIVPTLGQEEVVAIDDMSAPLRFSSSDWGLWQNFESQSDHFHGVSVRRKTLSESNSGMYTYQQCSVFRTLFPKNLAGSLIRIARHDSIAFALLRAPYHRSSLDGILARRRACNSRRHGQ